MTDLSTLRTPLHSAHLRLGAKMVPFAGFDMPVHYGSIIDEHLAVRQAVGLFDVSHMGEVLVEGPRALDFIQHLVTNDASVLTDGRAQYTVMCREDGGVVDDLLVYRINASRYMLVINAANRDTDLKWMRENNPMGATLTDVSDAIGLIAVQGPRAMELVNRLSDTPVDDIKFYHFRVPAAGQFLGCQRAILSHTGYTGEAGMEIYCEADKTEFVWNALLEAGKDLGVVPVGLGARDTLRLEAGYCLYGNDLTLETNPLEAGLAWLTKLDKTPFNGQAALRAVKEARPARRLVAFVLSERGIPRQGFEIADADGRVIGVVTSGTQSPVLGKGIGMGYVTNDAQFTTPGSLIHIVARGRALTAEVRKPPLHKSES